MKTAKVYTTILIADDDEDDILLMKDAIEENQLHNHLHFVHDGEELMDYLARRGQYEDLVDIPHPSLILLDLNMPKKSGHEALKEIKTNPKFQHIPVVILSTSTRNDEITRSYELGANSFITKPVSFQKFVQIINTLNQYWFNIVELPHPSHDI